MGFSELLPGGKNEDLNKVLGGVALIGGIYSALKPPKPKPEDLDEFSLAKFTANLNADGRRMAKGYHYTATIFMTTGAGVSPSTARDLTLKCTKVNLPGWRAKTQSGKIYGLAYETVVGIEQDPIWLTFNIDIKHMTETVFMKFVKEALVDARSDLISEPEPASYSPKYKEKYQFSMQLQVTDENFQSVGVYTFHNANVKTVQQVQYGSDTTEISTITAEIVYEYVTSKSEGKARDAAPPNKSAKDRNKLKLGPFQTDISGVNQVVDGFGKIPSWFDAPDTL